MTNANATTPAALRATYRQVRAQYDADPTNPNARRALGWAYANLLKEASGQAEPTRLVRGLTLLADFPMPDDARWRESVLWSVCRFLLRHKPDTLTLGPLADITVLGSAFVPAEPCLVRSVWWRAVLRYAPMNLDWLGLFQYHGWDGGFRPDDEAGETYGEGKTARPLVEGLVQAVAKQLLQLVVLPHEVAAPWLDRMADLTARHPDWDFLPYYHAKLLIRLDRADEAMAVFLPFARARKREFWVWSLLAELVDAEQVGACYARALTVGAPEGFLVKLRQRVAGWLIGQHRWTDARAELDRLVQTRQANQWPIPAEVQGWMNDSHYLQAETVPPGGWYSPLLPAAEALLWADVPETVALITGIDAAGQYANVAIDAQTSGSFPVRKFGLTPAVGDRVVVRYNLQEKKGRVVLQVQTAMLTTAPPTYLETRQVTGPLRMVAGKGIAFVGNVYVPADVLAKATVSADTLVTVVAISAWDGVKKQVGWRAFQIGPKAVNLSDSTG